MNDHPWFITRGHRLMSELLEQTGVNLSGLSVYTEAATNQYSLGPSLALMAGAKAVHCVARDSRFGPADHAIDQTMTAADQLGLDCQVLSHSIGHCPEHLAEADVLLNTGPLRPIDEAVICHLSPNTVISLMYEPWEFRGSDIALEECSHADVWVVGVNEMHPTNPIFPAAAMLIVKALSEAELGIFGNKLLLVSPNRMGCFAAETLAACGAHVDVIDQDLTARQLTTGVELVDSSEPNAKHYDALILNDVTNPEIWNVARTADAIWDYQALGSWDACIQMMGDVRRDDFPNVKFIPTNEPPRGHMGLNPAYVGLDLVLRLVVAGLAAGAEGAQMIRNYGSIAAAQQNLTKAEWILPLERSCTAPRSGGAR